MKKYLLILFISLMYLPVAAQDEELSIEEDETYEQFAVTSQEIQAWRNDDGFAYMSNLDSLLKAYQDREKPPKKVVQQERKKSWVDQLFSSKAMGWIGWLLAFTIFGFVLYRFLSTEGIFVNKRNRAKVIAPETKTEEDNIHDVDFDNLLKQAIHQENYRHAVKYAYLRTLRQLQIKEYLHLESGKTNVDYLRALPNELRPSFAILLQAYEYIWYGEKTPDKNSFQKILHLFNQFNDKI